MIQNVDLKVVGVTFTNEDGSSRKEQILTLAEQYKDKLGDIRIDLVREAENKYDINAVKVLANDVQIGYIGKEYAAIIAPLMDEYEVAFSGCRNALFRMKENWANLHDRFEGSDKLWKKMRKTTDAAEFRRLSSELLHTCPMK